ncbi:AUGMIN subunit 8-like [Curcuma longa]|uniref:AUGMIN subunit 8-like n=1 Tax=Curcuma longa TaxID=136217 RepID=UPI003D9DB505
MDTSKVKPPKAMQLQKISQTQDNLRLPLVPSEKNNAIPATRKVREVASRYKDGISFAPISRPSSPKRFPSPNAVCTSLASEASQPKRAQSAERRRPVTPTSRFSAPSSPSNRSTPSSPSSRPTTSIHDTATSANNTARKILNNKVSEGLWPSMRNVSSLQSEPLAVSVSKSEKLVANSSTKPSVVPERKLTPLRGRSTSVQPVDSKPLENSNARVVIDHHRWPAMQGGRLSANIFSMSADPNDKVNRSLSLVAALRVASPKKSEPSSESETTAPHPSSNEVSEQLFDTNGGKVKQDVKSPRHSSSTLTERSTSVPRPIRTRSSPIPVLNCPASPSKLLSTSSTTRGMTSPSRTRPSTPISPSDDATNSASSTTRGMSSPYRTRPSTPISQACTSIGRAISLSASSGTKGLTSPSRTRPSTPFSPCGNATGRSGNISSFFSASSAIRGMTSPSRIRPSTPFSPSDNVTNRAGGISSVLTYSVDSQREKNAKHLEDAHQLKLLYNSNIQWHFVNAEAEKALSVQKIRAENDLLSVWDGISEFRDSVAIRRTHVQHLQLKMKFGAILKEQIAYLEHYVTLEREHKSSLCGTIEAVKAGTSRLPVTGARANILDVKKAITSAVDIMQAMASSICYLLPKVEATKTLISKLSAIVAADKIFLEQCRDLLGLVAAMQVESSSLRAHLIQLRQDTRQLHKATTAIPNSSDDVSSVSMWATTSGL